MAADSYAPMLAHPGARYAQQTTDSRNFAKRWLHRQRFGACLKLLDLAPGQRLLDYGCGDGELSLQASAAITSAQVVAFDPAPMMFDQAERKLAGRPNVVMARTLDRQGERFDRIACLETLEHLPPGQLQVAFDDVAALLAHDGRCLFTIPIEHGLAGLVKNVCRVAWGNDDHASLFAALRVALGRDTPRERPRGLCGQRYIYSHVGFNCRDMIAAIGRRFHISRVSVLPLGAIALGLGNSVAVLAERQN